MSMQRTVTLDRGATQSLEFGGQQLRNAAEEIAEFLALTPETQTVKRIVRNIGYMGAL